MGDSRQTLHEGSFFGRAMDYGNITGELDEASSFGPNSPTLLRFGKTNVKRILTEVPERLNASGFMTTYDLTGFEFQKP